MTDDEHEITQDLRLYGSAFWRMVDGKRVHVPMSDVRYPPGGASDTSGRAVSNEVHLYSQAQPSGAK